jgi:hypothetical protein
MCGIVGWITTNATNSLDRLRYIEQALIVDTLRGDDSAGVFAVEHQASALVNNGLPRWGKAVGTGYNLLQQDEYKRIVHSGIQDYRAMIGHNRAATIGGVSVDTAHPFQEGDITLVHNGTLHTTAHMKITEWEADAENDSHTIAHNFAKHSVEDTVADLDGAYALAWHDKRDESINLLRNKDRPLAMTMGKHNSTLFFASEAGMLSWILGRLKVAHGPMVVPKPGAWLKFLPGAKLTEPVVKHLEMYTHIFKSAGFTNHGYDRPKDNGYSTGTHQSTGTTGTTGNSRSLISDDKDPRIFLGGTKKPVPPRQQELLMDLDLEPGVCQTFVPKQAEEVVWPRKKGKRTMNVVRGYIASDDAGIDEVPVVLYNVPSNVWMNHQSMLWSIRPIGVRYIDNAEPVVIGKLHRYTCNSDGVQQSVNFYETAKAQRIARMKRNAKQAETVIHLPHDKSEDDAKRSYDEMIDKAARRMQDPDSYRAEQNSRTYLGKYGATVNWQTWLHDTMSGCVNCGANILTEDADHIEWVNGEADPMCMECQDERDPVGNNMIADCGYRCQNQCNAHELCSAMIAQARMN